MNLTGASKPLSKEDIQAAKLAATTPAVPSSNSGRKNTTTQSHHQFQSPARPSVYEPVEHLGRTPQPEDFGIADDLAEALVRYILIN